MSRWRQIYPHVVSSQDDAAAFVQAMGFCTWLPVRGVDFPNLGAVMGSGGSGPSDPADRDAASNQRQTVDAHAVMNASWFWKDDLHIARRVYYAKVIRGQPTFIAPDYLADFIAAIGGPGQAVERDPAILYREGRLSREALVIFQYLTDHPAEPTRALVRGLGPRARATSTAIERALLELQRRFIVCKVGISGRTRGTYSYVWDLVERFAPEACAQAHLTAVESARDRIRDGLADFGLTTNAVLEEKLFWWRGDL
jgi:hypothetical protein